MCNLSPWLFLSGGLLGTWASSEDTYQETYVWNTLPVSLSSLDKDVSFSLGTKAPCYRDTGKEQNYFTECELLSL